MKKIAFLGFVAVGVLAYLAKKYPVQLAMILRALQDKLDPVVDNAEDTEEIADNVQT